MAQVRQKKLGRYMLPTRAVKGLLENGIDESNIDKFKVKELKGYPGFGELAEHLMLEQRAKIRLKRKAKRGGVTPARNQRLTDEARGSGPGESRDPRKATPAWLRMGDDEVEPSRTLLLGGERLVLDLGDEHGFQRRHARWCEDIVRNGGAELQVSSIERLLVKIIRKAYADDATKGGTIGVETPEAALEGKADYTPHLR